MFVKMVFFIEQTWKARLMNHMFMWMRVNVSSHAIQIMIKSWAFYLYS